MNSYWIEDKDAIIKFELKYKDIIISRNFYTNNGEPRFEQFIRGIKRDTKSIIVPLFEKSRELDSQFYRNYEMKMQDINKSCKSKRISQKDCKTEIKKEEITHIEIKLSEEYLKNKKTKWTKESLML